MRRVWAVARESEFLAYYDAHSVESFRYAMRLTGDRSRAEDLVQDAFLGLLRQVKGGTVTEVGPGWIMVAIRHRFLDLIRADGREERRLRLVSSDPIGVDADAGAGDPLAGSSLSDRERAALTLRYVDGLPVAEVAAALATTVRATESLLMRAKARARAEVRDA